MKNLLLHSSVASSTKSYARAKFHQISAHYIVTPLSLFIAWLGVHTHIAYLILFLGAYFEALIGPSLFIPGELFLLGGSILAGSGVLDIWLVLVTLYGGAILGDTSSYWIGRAIGKSVFHEHKKFLNFKNYEKIEKLLDKYGTGGIFLARLIGPFSKLAPVTAGIFEIPFAKFLTYNIPGVLVGCGEFIAAGYFFGNRYEFVLLLFERYTLLFFLVLAVGVAVYWYTKKHLKKRHKEKHKEKKAK